jgi:hypothetical protein
MEVRVSNTILKGDKTRNIPSSGVEFGSVVSEIFK